MSANNIDSLKFYSEYYGHPLESLQKLIDSSSIKKHKIYLAGDSSLDNKHWLSNTALQPALNGYENILAPPVAKGDVSYFINKELQANNLDAICINCAIEESTIADRSTTLLTHDQIIRDNITESDIIIISVGGNDIALKPSPATIFNIAKLLNLNSLENLRKKPNECWGMPYFDNMFNKQLGSYIEKLTTKVKPLAVIVCMIYYPEEYSPSCLSSWADKPLGLLGYNSNPKPLQAAIRAIYNNSICNIEIPGVKIIPLPLYQTLNGKTAADYCARVEPSLTGGEKIAQSLVPQFTRFTQKIK